MGEMCNSPFVLSEPSNSSWSAEIPILLHPQMASKHKRDILDPKRPPRDQTAAGHIRESARSFCSRCLYLHHLPQLQSRTHPGLNEPRAGLVFAQARESFSRFKKDLIALKAL